MTALPDSLVRFESELEQAIRLRRRRRPRRIALRVAAVSVAASAIGLGVLSVLPGDGVVPGTGPSAVARAAAVIAPAESETIVHTVLLGTNTNPDGTISSARIESWQSLSPPYDRYERVRGGEREHWTVDGRPFVYIAHTNTIHTLAPGVDVPESRVRPADGVDDRLRTWMRGLVRSGEAREEGPFVQDGREVIRIVARQSTQVPGTATLIVDARTYAPIEWSLTSDDGIRETTRFLTYERLPATEVNLALLRPTAQHPDARIVRDGTIEGVDGVK